MQVLNTSSFLECLSPARMKSYQGFFYPSGEKHTNDDLVCIYHWNNEVSEIFWKLISLIEITMRNKIHKELSGIYFSHPKKRPGNGIYQNQFLSNQCNTPTIGCVDSCNWYHAVNFSGEPLFIITGRTHKKKRNNKYYLRNHPVTADDVISGTTFGFWRYIFKNLKNSGCPHLSVISNVFRYSPFYNQTINPSLEFKIDCRIEMIHQFRNRISHHEPIWKLKDMMEEKITPKAGDQHNVNVLKPKPSNKVEAFDHLIDYYQMMIEFLRWLDKDTAISFRSSWWDDRLRFLCSERGFNSLLKSNSHCDGFILSRSVFKRELKGILSKGRAKVILSGSKKAILIPLK